MSENKETLRQEAKRHRARMDPFSEDPEEAASLFFKAINPGTDKIVGGYWPIGREFDPHPILEKLLAHGNRCALPVMQPESLVLKFAAWNEKTEMKEGPFKVLQPSVDDKTEWLEPDIVIVPLLAFDRRGYRLGHGGGYYDTTLKDLRARKDILAVGVCYGQQACLFNLPVEEHDERLDWVITPKGTHHFE